MDEEIVECSICGENFDIEREGIDLDDQNFCDDCRDECTFLCPVCEESELEDNRGKIGSILIVNDGEEAGIPTGIYEIIRHPYFYGSCLGIDAFFENALKYLGVLPDGKQIDTNGYPCGHVCRYCDLKIKNNFTISNDKALNTDIESSAGMNRR